MARRLTAKEIKHDIREDEVQTFLARIFNTLESHPKAVFGTLIGIVAAVVLIAAGFSVLDSRREAAQNELAAAIEIYEAPIAEDGDTASSEDDPAFASEEERRQQAREAFEKIRGVGKGAAGEVAGLYLAEIAMSEGDKDAARAIWEEFLDRNEGHMLAVSVRLNLIHLDREQGKAEEVAAELEKELGNPRRQLPEDVILFELAQTREALGDEEAALDLYQRIIDEFPQSAYVARARQVTTSART